MDAVEQAQFDERMHREHAVRAAAETRREPPAYSGGVLVCTDCGEPMSDARLAAVPWAVRCVDCQQAMENESWT